LVDTVSLFNLPFVRVCLLGTVDDGSPLHALKGNYRLTELLFKKHVLEAVSISLHEAAKNGDIRGVRLALNWTMTSVDAKDQYGNTALYSACAKNRPEMVQFLLDADADADSRTNYGMTALDIAKHNCNTKIIQLLTHSCRYKDHNYKVNTAI